MKTLGRTGNPIGKRRLVLCLALVLCCVVIAFVRVGRLLPDALLATKYGRDPNLVAATPLSADFWSTVFRTDAPGDGASLSSSLDEETLGFVNRHNAMRRQLSRVVIDGGSVWPEFSDDKVWPLHFEWDRRERTLLVRDENTGQKCIAGEKTAFLFAPKKGYYGSMHTNLFHMIALLRTWDPMELGDVKDDTLGANRSGRSAEPIQIKSVALRAGGRLCFEKENGRLVRIEAPLPDKQMYEADLTDYMVVDRSHGVVLPMSVRVKPPARAFSVPLPRRFPGIIELKIDPNDIALEFQAEIKDR